MLFESLKIRDVNIKNRVVVSPMCQYSAKEGYVQTHHKAHYGQLALGGAGLVFVEATGVTAQGRITNGCLGIWDDKQINGLREITQSIKVLGSIPAIQLGHAGQKASMQRPWHGNGPQTSIDTARGDIVWEPIAPMDRPLDVVG